MDFVKREDNNAMDDENYKAYLENLQKSHPAIDPPDYQHTSLSMEQLHQVMQSRNAGTLMHNFQIPLSPRQMSTLMLKTNHLARNINELSAHLPRNFASEMDLIQNLANELPPNMRHEDLLLRTLTHEMELQTNLTQNLVQTLNEQDLQRNLNADLVQNLNRLEVNLPQNLGRELPHDLGHELDLSLHLNRPGLNQEVLNHEDARRTPMQCAPDNHLLDQNLAHRLGQNDQELAQRLGQNQNIPPRLDANMAQRLEQNMAPRLDSNMAQRLDQRLVNPSLSLHDHQRQIEQNEHGVMSMPFHIKAEQEDDGYFYDNIDHSLHVNGINGQMAVSQDQPPPTQPSLHQDNQNLYVYNNHPSIGLPAMHAAGLYSRTAPNYAQNYSPNNLTGDNPQNLVVHRQFENHSPYPQEEEFQKKMRQDGGGAKSDGAKNNEQPKENLKPTDENKLFYPDYQNAQYVGKNIENDSSAQNKLSMPEELNVNIKGEYACYKCNDVFPSKRGLKQHAKACSEDGASTESTDKSAGKFTCSQCAYRCQSPAILKIHERIHSGEKPFSCTFCDYKSGQKNNVAKHILVHMKEKPFKCQYCEYRCAQKNNLVVHERTHTGFKPFACPYCDYRTVQKPNLVKHMYLHTDQKPFGCDQCSYRCVQKTNLTKHKQRHTNERNVEMKNQNKPYRPRQKTVKCVHCPYRCVQKSSLDKHVQFKHSDVVDAEYCQERFVNSLNLMKNDDAAPREETIQNLSVKKDDQVYAALAQPSAPPPHPVQS